MHYMTRICHCHLELLLRAHIIETSMYLGRGTVGISASEPNESISLSFSHGKLVYDDEYGHRQHDSHGEADGFGLGDDLEGRRSTAAQDARFRGWRKHGGQLPNGRHRGLPYHSLTSTRVSRYYICYSYIVCLHMMIDNYHRM